MLQERDKIIDAGEREAERIIAEGEAEHARLVSGHEITVSAEHEGNRVIAEARGEAQRLRDEVDEYVDTTLANFEQFLHRASRAWSAAATRCTPSGRSAPSVPRRRSTSKKRSRCRRSRACSSIPSAGRHSRSGPLRCARARIRPPREGADAPTRGAQVSLPRPRSRPGATERPGSGCRVTGITSEASLRRLRRTTRASAPTWVGAVPAVDVALPVGLDRGASP